MNVPTRRALVYAFFALGAALLAGITTAYAETYPGSNTAVTVRLCNDAVDPTCTTNYVLASPAPTLESYVSNTDFNEWPQSQSVQSSCGLAPSASQLQEALRYGALIIRTNGMYRLHNPKWPDAVTDTNDQFYNPNNPPNGDDTAAQARTLSQRLEVSAVTQFISFGSQTQCNSVQWAMNGLDYIQMADQQYPASTSYDLRSSGEGVDLYSPWWLAVDGRTIGDEALYITNPSGAPVSVHVWAGKNGGCNNCQGDAFSQDISISGSSTYTLRMPGISGPQVHVHSNDGISPVFAEQWVQAMSGAYSTFQLVPYQNFATTEYLPLYTPTAYAMNIPVYNPSGTPVAVQVTGPGVNQSYTINAWSTYLVQISPNTVGTITIQTTSPAGALVEAAEDSYQINGSQNFWWMVPAQPRATLSTDLYFPWYASTGQAISNVQVFIANPGSSPATYQLWANKNSQCYTSASLDPGQTQSVICPSGSGPEIHVVGTGGALVAAVRINLTSGFWQDSPMLPRRSLSPTFWTPYYTGTTSAPQSELMFYNPNIPDNSGSGGFSGLVSLNWTTTDTLSIPAFYATILQHSASGTIRGWSTNSPQADLLQSEWVCVQNCTYYFNTMAAPQ